MIVALPTETSGEKSFISEHFGRSNFYYIYNTETATGEVFINPFKDAQGGAGIKASEFILEHKTDVLITPRVGEKALRVFKSSAIVMYKSTDKIVKENIASFLNKELELLF